MKMKINYLKINKELNEKIDDLDKTFLIFLLKIEGKYSEFNKIERIRIENWIKKFCEVNINIVWKHNRNAFAKLLLECIKNKKLSEPFNSNPPEGSLPNLNKIKTCNDNNRNRNFKNPNSLSIINSSRLNHNLEINIPEILRQIIFIIKYQ